MNVTLDLSSKTPLYQQLAQRLILEMAKGKLKNGDRLPSIRDLAIQANINLHTVHKSYKELQNKGLIEVKPKSKAFVFTGKSSPPKESKLYHITSNLEFLLAEACVIGLDKEELQQLFNQIIQKYSIS